MSPGGITDRIDAWRAWWAVLLGVTVATAAAALTFPEAVYDEFLWRYFWGPVVADGNGATCAVRVDGATQLLGSDAACRTAAGVVAEPGYTTVSTIGYALILLFAVIGIYLGLVRYEVGTDPTFFFALVPFIFLGGALRAMEDATLAVPEGTAFVPSFPATAVLISPFIYVFVFVLVLLAMFSGIALERRGLIDSFGRYVVAVGSALVVLTLVYIAYLATRIPDLTLSVPMFLITLAGATAVTAAVHVGVIRFVPVVHEATGAIGPVIIWGHAVDGFANVLSLDWGDALGLGQSYGPKHVINELIVETMDAVQPAAVSAAIGTAWPFLLLKVAVATLVVWVFNEEMFKESPRFAILMLVAVLAVGLGPGTRDLLRATLGI